MGNSAIPESLGVVQASAKGLSVMEEKIFMHVLDNWPTSALEIASHFKEDLGSREKKKQLSTKYSYYLQKLVGKRLVFSKRVGNALVVWPLKVEKYRAIHSILSREEP